MKTPVLNIEKLQQTVAQCVRLDCPSAEQCLRQIVRHQCDPTLETVKIVNPDAIALNGDKCQFFKSVEGTVYGVGFTHYFDLLSHTEAKTAFAVLQAYFRSRAQYSRYRNGQFRLSPARLADINALLRQHGVTVPFDCDSYEVGL